MPILLLFVFCGCLAALPMPNLRRIAAQGAVSTGRIRNVDIVPTLARLLGLELPRTDGRVLEELLNLPP
jgi:hypothetical protein